MKWLGVTMMVITMMVITMVARGGGDVPSKYAGNDDEEKCGGIEEDSGEG